MFSSTSIKKSRNHKLWITARSYALNVHEAKLLFRFFLMIGYAMRVEKAGAQYLQRSVIYAKTAAQMSVVLHF